MTIADAIDTVKRVSMGAYRPTIRIAAEPSNDDGFILRLTMGPLTNADTGEDDGMHVNRLWRCSARDVEILDTPGLVRIVAREVKELVVHEVEEHFRVAGARMFEPHAKERR